MTGQRYAAGRRAYGYCARSGQRLLLREMVEDPRTGLLVAPDWAEPVDPRPPTDLIDGIALHRVAPDPDRIGTMAYIGTGSDPATGGPLRPLCALFEMGRARGIAA